MPGRSRVIDPRTRDYVSDGKGGYLTTQTIAPAVYHQMQSDLNAWVGDPGAGIDMAPVKRRGTSEANATRAKRAILAALQPLVDAGRAANPNAAVTRSKHRFDTEATIEDVQFGVVEVTPLLPFGP